MDKQLLDILACPRCHGDLTLKHENNQDVGLICAACSVMYPIREDIPIMLVDETQPLTAVEVDDTDDTSNNKGNI